jgi:hypothetical protein
MDQNIETGFRSDKKNIDYFFYIIILILLIYAIILYINYFLFPVKILSERFLSVAEQELITSLRSENEMLLDTHDKIVKKLKQQTRASFLSSNYDKVDEASYSDENNFINASFNTTKLSEIDINKFKVIKTEEELNDILTKASKFKNIYEPGDNVVEDSNFNITSENICYNTYQESIRNDPDFIKNHPKCMVCSIHPIQTYKDTPSWKATQTNIEHVCLYNPSAESNSKYLNYDGCMKMCNIPTRI